MNRRRRILRELLRVMPEDVLLLSFGHLSKEIPDLISSFRELREEDILNKIVVRLKDFKNVCQEMRRRNISRDVPQFVFDLQRNPLFL